MDEGGLALDGLPHVDVEAALGGVAENRHLVVLVALAQSPPLPLGDVGRPPGTVKVMQRESRRCTLLPTPIFSVDPTRTAT